MSSVKFVSKTGWHCIQIFVNSVSDCMKVQNDMPKPNDIILTLDARWLGILRASFWLHGNIVQFIQFSYCSQCCELEFGYILVDLWWSVKRWFNSTSPCIAIPPLWLNWRVQEARELELRPPFPVYPPPFDNPLAPPLHELRHGWLPWADRVKFLLANQIAPCSNSCSQSGAR